jgi:hypothetical protein
LFFPKELGEIICLSMSKSCSNAQESSNIHRVVCIERFIVFSFVDLGCCIYLLDYISVNWFLWFSTLEWWSFKHRSNVYQMAVCGMTRVYLRRLLVNLVIIRFCFAMFWYRLFPILRRPSSIRSARKKIPPFDNLAQPVFPPLRT